MSVSSGQMPGVKRDLSGAEKEKDVRASPFMPMFEAFREEIDEHHDRRERIIKASRDITAISKKMSVRSVFQSIEPKLILSSIFALQRVRSLRNEIPPKIASEIQERGTAIQKQFKLISPDLLGINAWRYQRQVSPGIQEFMEALSFEHYVRHQTLITLEEASKSLASLIILTGDDYLLGIFDLVGELMRFAITTMATNGALPGSTIEGDFFAKRDILMDLRALRTSFQTLDTTSCGGNGLGKDVEKKMEVMKTSVEKVETAVYGMIIRGRERPNGWILDLTDDRKDLAEGY